MLRSCHMILPIDIHILQRCFESFQFPAVRVRSVYVVQSVINFYMNPLMPTWTPFS